MITGAIKNQVISQIIILILLPNVLSLTPYPGHCSQCEEEIWEEVPCSDIVTTTTLPPLINLTSTTLIPKITTTLLPLTSTTVVLPVTSAVLPSEYKRCYCECKVGCREFCRKVVVNVDPRQEITQVSKTAQAIPDGIIAIEHLHQRKLQPSYPNPLPLQKYNSYPIENSEESNNVYNPTKPVITPSVPEPLPIPTQYQKYKISSKNLVYPPTVYLPNNPEPNYQEINNPEPKVYRRAPIPINRYAKISSRDPISSPDPDRSYNSPVPVPTPYQDSNQAPLKNDPAFEPALESYLKNFIYSGSTYSLSANQSPYSVTY